jgi:uncharacterized membrane protein YfcA
MTAVTSIFIALAGFVLTYLGVLVASLSRASKAGEKLPVPTAFHLLIGFVTNFFDTLGIGSFATTTAVFKFRKMLPDQLYPGTLNVGHTLPAVFQAFIFIAVVDVDPKTLVLLIASAVIGAWFGAGIVAGFSRRTVQTGMGVALLVAASAMFMSQLKLFPVGGTALGLEGGRLVMGVVGNLILGAMMTLGIGLFAPCMTLISLLGMNPTAAFPIMMGSCAFLMPVASMRFIKKGAYSPKVALGLAAGGLLGVPLAAFVVKSLPLTVLRWVVIVVVVYAAVLMLRSAAQEAAEASAVPA